MRKLSLRIRLTILTAILLSIASVALTVASMYTAKYIFRINSEEVDEERIVKERRFNYYGLGAMIIVIVTGTAAAYFIAGKALKPATDLSQEIEERDESDLFSPIDYFDSHDEVSRLAASFNKMIAKLETAYNTQKRFSANAAHELRTPLSSMIAAIEVLKIDETQDITEYKEVTDDVLDNALRLKTLIDNLLKLNTTANAENYQNFDLSGMLDGITNELKPSCEKSKIKIISRVENCFIYGDKELLQRAFFNVVQNAVKYNRPSGSIEIGAEILSENDSPYIKISVYDTGIGIQQEEFDKVFEPFYCVDKSRSRESGGSGLGLSLVKTIIQKHGGKISIESEYGKYTQIKILLPILKI